MLVRIFKVLIEGDSKKSTDETGWEEIPRIKWLYFRNLAGSKKGDYVNVKVDVCTAGYFNWNSCMRFMN